jgi:hypothetical protein
MAYIFTTPLVCQVHAVKKKIKIVIMRKLERQNKVKLALCLIKQHVMKIYVGVEV